jgi:hypothetical protein
MTKQQDTWFLTERAAAFASLVLTKRHDVRVQPFAGHGKGIDLLVENLKDGKTTLRLFGVQIVAHMDLPNDQNGDERILSRLGRDGLEAALPLCVFVIGVRKPEGIYRWAVEPVVEDGHALLCRNSAANWQPLDTAGAARLIDQVNAWYDALDVRSVPKSRGRRSKTGS